MQKKMKSRVFVTGATGFVGANIVRMLLQNKYEVHVILRSKKTHWRLKEIEKNITLHQGDITDYPSLKKTLQKIKPDYIIHLAVYGAYHYQTELEKIINVNVVGTRNLLEASKDIPYKAFINTGSSSEYGFKNKPMKETDYCDPVSYYAATKLAATHLCKVFALQHNKPIMTVRLFSAYGPYEELTRFIPTIMFSILNKTTIKLTSGNQRRDFIYIDDICEAYKKALQHGKKIQGEICNLGTGTEYTNDEMVETLFEVVHKKTNVQKGGYKKRSWDTEHWVADTKHAKRLLQWKSTTTVTKGLENTYNWFQKNSNLYR